MHFLFVHGNICGPGFDIVDPESTGNAGVSGCSGVLASHAQQSSPILRRLLPSGHKSFGQIAFWQFVVIGRGSCIGVVAAGHAQQFSPIFLRPCPSGQMS